MRLAYLCAQPLGESPRARAWELARRMLRRGHRVTVFAPRGGAAVRDSEIPDGVELALAPAGGALPGFLAYLLAPRLLARECARRGPFDLVHAFQAPLPASATPALKLAASGLPLVVDWEEDYSQPEALRRTPLPALLHGRVAGLEQKTARAARAVVVVSAALRQRAERLGVPAERIHVIGNGADGQSPSRERDASRKALGWPAGAAMLVCHAADCSALQLAAGALRDLRPAHPSLMLALVGEPGSGRIASPVWDWAQSQRALVVEKSADPAHLRQCCGGADILLLPREDSPFERARFPLALGQYLAAGRSVVASDVGEVGRLLRERLCGVVAQNQEQFTRRIEELLANAERRQRLEQLARHTAETVLAWDSRADELAVVYANLAATGRT